MTDDSQCPDPTPNGWAPDNDDDDDDDGDGDDDDDDANL
jgi:hypothetical protein